MNEPQWIPEICYEDDTDGITSHIPFISVPLEAEMPHVLFIFESRDTGEFEPGHDGQAIPIVDLDLHQYADMNVLRDTLPTHLYDTVRQAIGLAPLVEAVPKGVELTNKIRDNISNLE